LRGEVPRLSSGRWQADWIYIDDVVDGLIRAAQAHDVEGCTIDLGSGALVPIYTMVQQLMKFIDSQVEPLFGAVPDRPLEEVRIADTVYAHAKLNWKPRIPLEKGLEHTVEWYKRQLKASSKRSESALKI
jgi:nucleoside-diphosphate-sugar epimerase